MYTYVHGEQAIHNIIHNALSPIIVICYLISLSEVFSYIFNNMSTSCMCTNTHYLIMNDLAIVSVDLLSTLMKSASLELQTKDGCCATSFIEAQ